MSELPRFTYNQAFGRVIADLRRSAGLSQEKLGFEAEMDRSHISLLERGKRSPTLDTVIRLCRVFGVSFPDIAQMVEVKLDELSSDESI